MTNQSPPPAKPANLTEYQFTMLRCSGFDPKDGNGFGVTLRGSRDWRAARKLEALGLGWIQGGKPNGSELPGMFFSNHEGTAITHPDKLEEFLDRKGRI